MLYIYDYQFIKPHNTLHVSLADTIENQLFFAVLQQETR